ncbi:MAG: HAF repeat-containing protein [Desulfuromonadales bacterium]|nr:HAF repeat-containing protein [Desulfuromonadales bacterium]
MKKIRSKMARTITLAAVLPIILSCPATVFAAGSMKDLGTLGGHQSWAYAMNDSGQVVGKSDILPITNPAHTHAFLYSGGVMINLGTLGGTNSEAWGINNSGQVVGWSENSSSIMRAFLYSGGVMTDLGTLNGGTSSRAYAINNAGQIAGVADDANSPHTGAFHAFLYSRGGMTDLGNLDGNPNHSCYGYAINNNGEIVGSCEVTGAMHAFRYSGGVMTDLGTLGGPWSEAHGINDAGEVVGWSNTSGGLAHAFRYSGGALIDMGTLNGGQYDISGAFAVNYAGQIVGQSSATKNTHAFLYSGSNLIDLGTLGSASEASYATAIDSAGLIAGYSTISTGYHHAFLYTPDIIPVLPVHVEGGGYYSSLQEAYTLAPATGTIMVQKGELPGNLSANLNKTVTLEGGYDSDYSSNNGQTTLIHCNLLIGTGSITVENIAIR